MDLFQRLVVFQLREISRVTRDGLFIANIRINQIMTKISDFAAAQAAFSDRLETAINGVQADIKQLNDVITKLQNTPGAITPEDQALLDNIQKRSEALAVRLEAVDTQTPALPAGVV